MWGCVWVWCGGIYERAEVTYDEIIDSDYHSEISFGLNKNKYAANALLEDEKRKNMAALYKQFENHLGLESQFSPKKPETPKFVAKRGFHFAYLLIAAVWFLLQSIVLLSASTTNPSAYFIDTILYTGHGLSLLSSFFPLPSFPPSFLLLSPLLPLSLVLFSSPLPFTSPLLHFCFLPSFLPFPPAPPPSLSNAFRPCSHLFAFLHCNWRNHSQRKGKPGCAERGKEGKEGG